MCNWCYPDACPALPPRCYNCHAVSPDSAVCSKCRRQTPLKHVWVRTDYDGAAKLLVQKYKFGHARSAAPLIADFMIESLPYFEDVVVVPVPTATVRIRQRGFDHADLLAKQLAHKINQRYVYALSRLGQTKQVGTKRAQRLAQLSQAFRANLPLDGARVLLVDDVLTTGATLSQAARILRQAGAKTVDAVVFAQKQ